MSVCAYVNTSKRSMDPVSKISSSNPSYNIRTFKQSMPLPLRSLLSSPNNNLSLVLVIKLDVLLRYIHQILKNLHHVLMYPVPIYEMIWQIIDVILHGLVYYYYHHS